MATTQKNQTMKSSSTSQSVSMSKMNPVKDPSQFSSSVRLERGHISAPVEHKSSTRNAELLEIDRKFSVPVEKLFNAFTNSDALKLWWWPNGMYADQADVDFRRGGRFFVHMKGNTDNNAGGLAGHYLTIVPNKKIVMTDQFANDRGTIITAKDAKMPGDWPKMAYITFEFESLGNNSSMFHMYHEGVPNEFRKDCIQGWQEMFDKLEACLSGPRH